MFKMFVFLLAIFGYDVWFYISHRLLHLPALYWIHRVHHEKVVGLRWPDTYYGHWFEGPFQSVGFLLPLAFGYGLVGDWVGWLAALAFVNARGMMRHDDRMVRWIGSHHLLHHRDPRVNYGEAWIDALVGTRRM